MADVDLDADDDDDRRLTNEDLGRALEKMVERWGPPKYSSAEEEYAALRAQFETACRRLHGRGASLRITQAQLADAFLRHPAKRLLARAIGESFDLRRLDARQVFVQLGQQWARSAEPAELPVGLGVLRRLMQEQPAASSHTAHILSDVVAELLARGRSERDPVILTEGLLLSRDVVLLALPMSELAAVAQRQRGECAYELFLLTGDTSALSEAVLALRAAVAASPHRVGDGFPWRPLPGYPYLTETEDPRETTGRVRAGHLALLARCLLDRYALTGEEDERRAAVAALREALDVLPHEEARYQLDLARALTTGSFHAAALDEAIALAEAGRGADGAAELGRLLELRFRDTGRTAELRRAAEVLEQGSGPARDAQLARVLTRLYEQVRDSSLLQRAIGLHRSALSATPGGDRATPDRLAACAETLVLHAERHSDVAALREAVDCYREALRHPMLSHRATVALRTGLTLVLHRLGVVVADAAVERDEAMVLAQAVVTEFPVGHPERDTVLAPLAPVLVSRLGSQARTSETDLERVIEITRGHVAGLPEQDPTRPLRLMELGVALGERFGREAREGDRREACAAFADAARSTVLPAVTRCLAARKWATLLAGAGEWTGAAGAYRLAVELLPGVAVRELRRDDQEFHLTSFARLASDAAAAVLRAGGHAEEALALLESGRGILLSQAIDSDPDAGRDDHGAVPGPVIAVNASVHGCDALIVGPGGCARIPLPGLGIDEIADRSEAFTIAVEIALRGDHAPEHQVAANRFVTRTLGWLWDTLAEPVLAEVRADRLWWLPTGALSFLPLHAAGYHDDGSGRTVMDRAVSSYTPTLRMLRRSRAQASRITLPPDPLVVSMPETPGAPPLPGVVAETEQLLRLRPGARVLRGPDATRQATLAALRTGGWAHFACHGVSDPIEPSASHLMLNDGPLSVLDLVRLRAEHAGLAYLSACSTARGGARLADEAIHIGSALQLAGYPHVVATLWPIADAAASTIADAVYRTLDAGPAAAVHAATRRLRDQCSGRSPLLWASHIHLGA